MPVGRELKVRVFFAEEFEFDQFKTTARIAWKGHHSDEDWEGYKYALEFVEISVKNRQKLVNLLRYPEQEQVEASILEPKRGDCTSLF